jgi:hypothetical protein
VGHDLVGWRLSDERYREWVGNLEARTALGSVYWVRSRERNPYRRGCHFHGLVGGVGSLSRRDAWREWFERNGMARIEPIRSVDSRAAVVAYVSKYVLKEDGEMMFSDNAGLHQIVRNRDGE